MPSKSLADLPSTPSPTALSAQTAHPRQILTPLLSFTSALLSRSARDLPHSFLPRANSARGAQTTRSLALFRSRSKERKSSRVFSTACALFAKKTGVYPSRSLLVSTVQLLTALDSILTETPSCRPFRMNTQHPTKDADPERPPGAEGFLPYSGPTLTTVESILTESGHRNSFRMNTYDKTGEGGPPMNDPLSHSCLPRVPSTRGPRFLAPRALFEGCHARQLIHRYRPLPARRHLR